MSPPTDMPTDAFDDPFDDSGDEEPGAPPESLMGEWPGDDYVEFEVRGDPVPWAPAAHNPKTGGRFIPGRQAKQAALFIQRWQTLGLAPVPAGDPSRGLVIELLFYVERPKKHFGTGRNSHVLKDRYRGARPTGRPDLSNLVKLVEDALTKNAWADDDQIVRIIAEKDFGTRARTIVRVWLAPPSGHRPEPPVDQPALAFDG